MDNFCKLALNIAHCFAEFSVDGVDTREFEIHIPLKEFAELNKYQSFREIALDPANVDVLTRRVCGVKFCAPPAVSRQGNQNDE